jgi:hypothetical protein
MYTPPLSGFSVIFSAALPGLWAPLWVQPLAAWSGSCRPWWTPALSAIVAGTVVTAA